jgi:hypothetical protein
MKRVLVTGSRTWSDGALITRVIDDIRYEIGMFVLVHGAATGVDTIASRWQTAWGRPSEAHPADWDRYGKRAGYVRNAEMVDAGADLCLAFIHNRSRGATMCADLAEKAGIPVRRYEINDVPEES